MKYLIEKIIRNTFNTFGLDLHRHRPQITLYNNIIKSLNHFKIDTILDIGANIGQFAISLRQAGYQGQIISFEPLSDAYAKLYEQAAIDPRWKIHPRCALGDRNGETKINISGNSESSSILEMMESHSIAAPESKYIGSESCPIHTLDFIAKNYLNKDSTVFLKLDTQGYEWQVLDGAIETLPLVHGILLEASMIELYSGQRLWKDFIQRLEKEGFEIWSIDQVFSDPKTGKTLQYDMVFFRRYIL